MIENYRKPIASIEKLPRFTTMNVIDGQAGLAIYASLIFYSLTIDNILNIIVLLILAGVAISMLSGENGILQLARKSKEQTELTTLKEELSLYKMEHYYVNTENNYEIEADNENLYINGNLVSGNINDVLPSLKNTSLKDKVTIKYGIIHIDLDGKDSSIKEYVNNNQDDFYFVEYGNNSDWEIQIVSETDKTCKINKIKQSNVKDEVLRIPDYIIKNGQKYKVIGNNSNIIEGTLETKKIVIPETYTERFNRLGTLHNPEIKKVEEVYIYNGCTSTGYGLFGDFDKLKKITLPNTLTAIGGASFWKCRELQSIELPTSLKQIDGQAFYGSGITKITIPKNVTKIGIQVFQCCYDLKEVIFQNELLVMPRNTFIMSGVEKIQFPKNIEELDENSMGYARFKEIDLPKTIIKIGAYAFGNINSDLQKIRIPNSVQEIGTEVFSTSEGNKIALNNLTIYTDNTKFIQYMRTNYPDFTRIKPYNEW